ncbi:hypothetical protein D0469_03485 [Peribacillus saganii]|uniref:Uncharacterized protein n=1 Tax=Peribacillus saganii TaxID=2303992 RepID=A0A372LS42_9BACI|nr:hypothetical protein [Peribacillus saganii]RFU71015.1 hypothetical protein D0469_03485 [Peribacillus saganii]
MSITVQVRFVKTIVGWYNLYLSDAPETSFVNLSPDKFSELLPGVSAKARYGCNELSAEMAVSLFGSLAVSQPA